MRPLNALPASVFCRGRSAPLLVPQRATCPCLHPSTHAKPRPTTPEQTAIGAHNPAVEAAGGPGSACWLPLASCCSGPYSPTTTTQQNACWWALRPHLIWKESTPSLSLVVLASTAHAGPIWTKSEASCARCLFEWTAAAAPARCGCGLGRPAPPPFFRSRVFLQEATKNNGKKSARACIRRVVASLEILRRRCCLVRPPSAKSSSKRPGNRPATPPTTDDAKNEKEVTVKCAAVATQRQRRGRGEQFPVGEAAAF